LNPARRGGANLPPRLQDYQIHLVTGIGSNNIKHYKIPGKELLDRGSPEVSWWLPLKKDFRKYELP